MTRCEHSSCQFQSTIQSNNQQSISINDIDLTRQNAELSFATQQSVLTLVHLRFCFNMKVKRKL